MKALLRIALGLALALPAAAILPGSAGAQDGGLALRSLTHQLAFDPQRFFPDSVTPPLIAIRYTGDDYGYPVYALAVRQGCTADDTGAARKTCGNRLIARMVHAPGIAARAGEGRSRRIAGAKVFAQLETLAPADEAALRRGIGSLGLAWLEADVNACPAAMAHLKTAASIPFLADPVQPSLDSLTILLHADKIELEFGGHLTRSRYYGHAKPGSAGEWADRFAASLADCWQPAAAAAPWLLPAPPEPSPPEPAPPEPKRDAAR